MQFVHFHRQLSFDSLRFYVRQIIYFVTTHPIRTQRISNGVMKYEQI